MMENRKYGWVPDRPDHRDKAFKISRVSLKLPDVVNLQSLCSPVEDQGRLGSCTAQAIAGQIEFILNKQGLPFYDISRLFVYYNERDLEGTIDSDAGASIRDGIKVLCREGYCTEALWPYIEDKFNVKPPDDCYEEARHHTISVYRALNSITDMQCCLAEGYPFILGISVFDNLESDDVAKSGILSMPEDSESSLGGHAVLCVGYNRLNRTFLIRNSWGSDWGQNGYFTVPFDYLDQLGSDFWTIRS